MPAWSRVPDEDWRVAELVYAQGSRDGASARAYAALFELGHTVRRNTIVRHMVERGIPAGNGAGAEPVLPVERVAEPAKPRWNEREERWESDIRAELDSESEQPAWPSLPLRAPQRPDKPVTHMVIPDTQCKPGVPLDHLYWAGCYARKRKPDVIVHLGDHWDMESLSSYDKGKHSFEGRRYMADIEAGNAGLREFERGLGNWQPARKVLLRGNHEDRITRALEMDPWLTGAIGMDHFNDTDLGWEVVPFLQPIEIDGVTYCHYFYQPNSGRPYSGTADVMLKNIGFTFTAGHQQGKKLASRSLGNGEQQRALIVGSFYQHFENYIGPQANGHWRGVIMKHEVYDGQYDLMEVSLDYLRAEFGDRTPNRSTAQAGAL